jgi:hypothetical protein
MQRIDIDRAIRLHTQWRRQFMNAFAGGDYADMPLSEHRGCTLNQEFKSAHASEFAPLLSIHERFHMLANEIIELSNNGLGDSADLLLPELNEASHQLVGELDKLREYRKP